MQQHTLNISDLRRGNYIEYNGKWERVHGITGDRVIFMEQPVYKEVPIVNCNPIHITSDILLKTVFQPIADYDMYSAGNYCVNIAKKMFVIENEFGMRHYIAPCKYLHTLQNLFYLMKEVELPITL